MDTCYYTIQKVNKRYLLVAALDDGLCYVDIYSDEKQGFQSFVQWCNKQQLLPINQPIKVTALYNQMIEYLNGKRSTFHASYQLFGTPFQKKVWQALLDIPYGETRSYSEIADAIKQPKAVRAVANAIGQNPIMVMVPCHRVIGKNGSLTGFGGGLELKKVLLDLEIENS